MSSLFEGDRQGPLASAPWDASIARAAIERIAGNAVASFDPAGL